MSNKYDRQLRLWGDFGQEKILNSKIALINATPAGCETLKNLILSGVGFVKIFDENLTTQQDLESNFFVQEKDIGKPRASVIEQLLEMNPEVKGSYEMIENEKVVNGLPLEDYQAIIACDLLLSQELLLSKFCEENRKGLFLIKSNGLITTLRVYKGMHESFFFLVNFSLGFETGGFYY